jgi:K+ transporter
MFDKSILETDEFLDLGMTSKALYFLLGMEADDEGFVSPKRVMRLYGGSEDDMKVLIAKNFCIKFDSGVIVITNWHENNYLNKERIKATRYQAEKKLLALDKGKYIVLNNGLTDVKQMLRENRIEENRREENRREENILAKKSTNKKPSSENKFSQEIGEIIQLFTEINPALNYSNKTQRKAVLDMIKKFGYQEVLRMAKQTISIQGEQYAPRVTTPYTMYQKLGDIAIYFKANNNPKILDLTK